MKRIVICCDGTWNRLDARHQTNVAKIAEAMLPCDAAGNAQIMLHLDGVGSGRGTGHIAQGMDRWLGGVLGIGLTEVIQEAYRFLVLNYDPGDEIMIFGFSRGAYTARSLGGMIRRCGIMEKRFASRVADAIDLYRARSDGAKTRGDRARRFRAEHSPRVVTEPEVELDWRRAAGLAQPGEAPPVLALRYLGIWDTVGSLGVPAGLLPIPTSERFRFHDVDLAETVYAARHALALDEHRFDFNATAWENLPKIEAKLPAAERGRRLQHWFPGVHGAVGGGSNDCGLSNCALFWVAQGAVEAGLALDPKALEVWRAESDPEAPLSAMPGVRRSFRQKLMALRRIDREGPVALADVSDCALARWRGIERYRPKALGRVAQALRDWARQPPEPDPRPKPASRAEPLLPAAE